MIVEDRIPRSGSPAFIFRSGKGSRLATGLIAPLVFLMLLFLGACRLPDDWYPLGTVDIAGYYELESPGTKTLVATVRIGNTGASVISRSTFGLRASTDIRCYYSTVVSETRILPGAAIWTSLLIPYADPVEYLIEDGLAVESGFFE